MGTARARSMVLVGAFVVLRLYATLGAGVGVASDTPTYFDFRWWGAIRSPVVAGLYVVVENHRAIVTVQAAVGLVCWSAAALLLGPLLQRGGVRTGFEGAVLALGLTVPVVRFDNTLLSESLSISLVVLLTALLLRLACQPSRRMIVATVITGALWGLSRPNNAIIVFLLGGALAFLAVTVRSTRRQLTLAGALVVVGLVGIVLATSNSTVQEVNTAQILDRRILGHPEYEAWFRGRGMPADAGQIAHEAPDGQAAIALMADPEFARWMGTEGLGAYTRFLLTHAGYLASTTRDDRYPVGAFFIGVDDWNEFGQARDAGPGVIDGVYWPSNKPEAVTTLLLLAGLGAAATVSVRRNHCMPTGTPMALTLVLLAIANVVLVTHTAGESYGRLLIASGVSARFAVLWWLASALNLGRTPTPAQHHGANAGHTSQSAR